MILQTALRHVYMTRGIVDILTVGSGAFKGFMDGSGIYGADAFLTVEVPLAFQSMVGAVNGYSDYIVEEGDISKGPAVVGGMLTGGALGALELGLGYSVGHTLGSIART